MGHVYSPESMLAHRLAERGRERSQHWVDQAFTLRAREAEQEANGIRDLLRTRASATHNVPDDAGSVQGPGEPEHVTDD